MLTTKAEILARLAAMGIEAGHSTGAIPDLDALPAPVRALYETAFGEATGHLFLVATPFAVLAFVCILFIREVPLRTTIERDVAQNAPVDETVETAGVTATDVVLDGTVFDIRDNFATSNVFHGGMLGLMGRRARGRWSLDWLTKLSLGANHQRVRIAGTTTIRPDLMALTAPSSAAIAV